MLSTSRYPRGAVLATSILVTTLVAPAVIASPPAADDAIVGTWNGTLAGPGFELRVAFHIVADDGSLSATLDSPDQGATGIPVDEVTFEDGRLQMRIAAIAGGYDGTLADDDGERVEGTWTQGGQSLPLNLARYTDE